MKYQLSSVDIVMPSFALTASRLMPLIAKYSFVIISDGANLLSSSISSLPPASSVTKKSPVE